MKKITLKEAKAIVAKYKDIGDFLINAPQKDQQVVLHKVAELSNKDQRKIYLS